MILNINIKSYKIKHYKWNINNSNKFLLFDKKKKV